MKKYCTCGKVFLCWGMYCGEEGELDELGKAALLAEKAAAWDKRLRDKRLRERLLYG